MSLDEFFEYLSANPNASDSDVDDAISLISDNNERDLASVSAWEFLASLRDPEDISA